MYHFYIIIS